MSKRVKFLKETKDKRENGTKYYRTGKNQVYIMADDLAKMYLNSGDAVFVDADGNVIKKKEKKKINKDGEI